MTRKLAHAKGATLSELDRSVLALADEIERVAEAARAVVARSAEATAALYGTEFDAEGQKEEIRERLARMRRVWARGLERDDAAPYRDARMLLCEGIVFYAAAEQAAPTEDNAKSKRAEARARALSRRIVQVYPSLAAKLSEPECVERIRLAIVAKTKIASMPWKAIVTAWTGIEHGPAPDAWKVDWARHPLNPKRRRDEEDGKG